MSQRPKLTPAQSTLQHCLWAHKPDLSAFRRALARITTKELDGRLGDDYAVHQVSRHRTWNSAQRLAVVQLLHGAGARLDTRDRKGVTMLHLAAECGDVGLVKWLTAHGADVNARDQDRGATPLHCAALASTATTGTLINALVQAGADLSARNAIGDTPLANAVRRSNTRAIEALAKAQIRAAKTRGKTSADGAFHQLVRQWASWIELDREHGDRAGHGAMDVFGDVLRALRAGGADLAAIDDTGATARDLAVSLGLPAPLVALLGTTTRGGRAKSARGRAKPARGRTRARR